MKIFIAYAAADRAVAERACAALRGAVHYAFFDRDDLPAGETFDLQILRAIEECDLLIFLASQHSIAHGAYSLTELGFAKRRWKNPSRRVIPVLIGAVSAE